MSSDNLSQSQIDQLLGGAEPDAGEGAVADPTSKAAPQLYDFRRPHRVSKERLRTLEAIYEQFSKSFEGWLMGRVRGKVELRLQSVEQFRFGEFTLSLPTPCAAFLFDIGNSGGQQGIVDFGHAFNGFLIDRLFGGSGEVTIPNRALTPMERMAVRVVAERGINLLAEAWQDHVAMDLAVSGFESIPEILRGANRDDPVLVATIAVHAANTESHLLICLPFAVLEKFFSTFRERRVNATATTPEMEEARELTEATLRASRVAVAARLPQFRLSMRAVSALRTGMVLPTGIPTDSELQVAINGQPRFTAAPGRVGRRLAVRVLRGGNDSTDLDLSTAGNRLVNLMDSINDSPSVPESPDFAELQASLPGQGEVPISMLLDLTLPVSIELGRTSMTVQDILRLGRGSVIQLDRLAGEPIDMYVADRRFAEGEVVVVGEHYGIRVTRLLSAGLPEEVAGA